MQKQIINILSNDDSFLPQTTPSAALPKQRLQATIGPLDSKTDTSQTNPWFKFSSYKGEETGTNQKGKKKHWVVSWFQMIVV